MSSQKIDWRLKVLFLVLVAIAAFTAATAKVPHKVPTKGPGWNTGVVA